MPYLATHPYAGPTAECGGLPVSGADSIQIQPVIARMDSLEGQVAYLLTQMVKLAQRKHQPRY